MQRFNCTFKFHSSFLIMNCHQLIFRSFSFGLICALCRRNWGDKDGCNMALTYKWLQASWHEKGNRFSPSLIPVCRTKACTRCLENLDQFCWSGSLMLLKATHLWHWRINFKNAWFPYRFSKHFILWVLRFCHAQICCSVHRLATWILYIASPFCIALRTFHFYLFSLSRRVWLKHCFS